MYDVTHTTSLLGGLFTCLSLLFARVRLIGSEDQDAVLVTEGKTFKLTKAETSNTLLLMPPEGTAVTSVPATACGKGGGEAGGGGFEAVAAVGFQYEVKKMFDHVLTALAFLVYFFRTKKSVQM